MLLLEQDITMKGWMNKFAKKPEFEFKLDNNKEYKMKAIQESAVYTKEADGHLLELYYLVAWKSYPEEKNTWKPSSTVIHFRKMVSTFYKNHLKKLIATLTLLNVTPPMVKPTI